MVCSSVSSLVKQDADNDNDDNNDNYDDDVEIVERDPTGRYSRYDEVLGEGTWKTVYKGFDEVEGIEIAWNQVELSGDIVKSEELMKSLSDEAKLLKSLKHENIMKCYHSWIDVETKTINMITELFTSGDLRHYCKKHTVIDRKAIKNWARQILKGLHYLHSHNPPIVHRDLKCENIFVNGNSGKVKIGDLGLATVLEQVPVRTVAGTPEFMAPEFYDEEYDQRVDIYAFGMCLLQMVTRELPYSECKNNFQIYRKVSEGIKPDALSKVADPYVRHFIEKCLTPASERPSAVELLDDPFLAPSSPPTTESPTHLNHSGKIKLRETDLSMTKDQTSIAADPVDVIKVDAPAPAAVEKVSAALVDVIKVDAPAEVEKVVVGEENTFRFYGKMEVNDEITMILLIVNLGGKEEKVKFSFSLQTDTALSVMEEMVQQLKLSTVNAAVIQGLMDEVIAELSPRSKSNLKEANFSNTKIDTVNQDDAGLRQMKSEVSGEPEPASQFEKVNDQTNLPSLSTVLPSHGCRYSHSLKEKDGSLECTRKGNRKRINYLLKLMVPCGKIF